MEQEYVELISKLTSDFEKRIPDNEMEKERLIEMFKIYLTESVSDIKNSKSKFISKDSETIKRILKKIAYEICEMDITSMKQSLLQDKSFEEIRMISGDAFELAKRKKVGENIEIDFDISDKIRQLDELLKKVEPYNIMKAKELISEAVLDLKYVCEDEKKVSSIRLYHFMNSQRRDKEEDDGR